MSCTVTCFYNVWQQVFSAWERKITVVMTSKDASRLTEKKLSWWMFMQCWLPKAPFRMSVCLSDGMEGRWGRVGCTEIFALEVLCIDCDRISREQYPQLLNNLFNQTNMFWKVWSRDWKSCLIKRSELLFLLNTTMSVLFCMAQLICLSFYHHAHWTQMDGGGLKELN